MSHQRILTLYPYLLDGTCWVFDDERTGLKEEAFVLGMTEMISRAVDGKGIYDAAKGFALSFSDEPFDDHDVELHWLRSMDARATGTRAPSWASAWKAGCARRYSSTSSRLPNGFSSAAIRYPPG